jgi:DNA-binding winged helix-turn-helix (wHTH) protein
VTRLFAVNSTEEVNQKFFQKIPETIEGTVHIDLDVHELEQIIKDDDYIFIYYDGSLDKLIEIVLFITDVHEICHPILGVITETYQQSEKELLLRHEVTGVIPASFSSEEFELMLTNNEKKRAKKTQIDKSIRLESTNRLLKLGNGKEIHLTKLEYQVMKLLLENETVTYEQIIQALWIDDGEDKLPQVSNIIFHLRQKFIKIGEIGTVIQTNRSVGYELRR